MFFKIYNSQYFERYGFLELLSLSISVFLGGKVSCFLLHREKGFYRHQDSLGIWRQSRVIIHTQWLQQQVGTPFPLFTEIALINSPLESKNQLH